MERPAIESIQTGEELQKWYWLKAELIAFAKVRGISYTGSKFRILERLAGNLDGTVSEAKKETKPASKFNWATAALTPETPITDSYKNGENTRAFFRKHCGEKFAFSIAFMAWMKENVGRTLQDAVEEWNRMQQLQTSKGFESHIPAGNQYNQYLRDFFADNPYRTMQEARHFWGLKRALPLGRHVYERGDLQLKEA